MAATYTTAPSVYQYDTSELDIEYDIGDLSNENKNTKRKTETDMRIFSAYLISLKEKRKAEDIPPQELDPYLCMFFSVVKKHDGHEYEPASLRGMLCSIERYLRMKGYQCSITRDAAFNNTRNTLKNKQRILRENGKTIKKVVPGVVGDPLGPSTVEKINHLYAAKELGPYNPMSVINSLCFAFVMFFKLRKAIDHKQLLWGDVVLKSSSAGEYLCYEPLEGREYIRTKLKGLEDCKVWCNSSSGPNKDPILIYKLYSQKRPAQMMGPESPFYLGVSTSHPIHNQPWYKSLPMGVNKLNDLVRMIRDITGIQKAHTYSNPNSPEPFRPTSPSVTHYQIKDDPNLKVDHDDDATMKDIERSYSHTRVGTHAATFRGSSLSSDDKRTIISKQSKTDPTDGAGNEVEANSDIAVDLRCADKTEHCGQTGNRETDLSLDEVKTLIRGLVKKLDKVDRVELVQWLNNLRLDDNKAQLSEFKQQGKQYQITFRLNTDDLNKHQPLKLTGSMELIGVTDTKSTTDTDMGCNSAADTATDTEQSGEAIYRQSPQFKVATIDDNDHTEFTTNLDSTSRTNNSSSISYKRTVSESLSPSVEYLVPSKKLRFGRSFSHQDAESGCEVHVADNLDAESLHTEHYPVEDKRVHETHSDTSESKIAETADDVVISRSEALRVCQPEIQSPSPVFVPRWIPPQVFQQLAYHPLTSYTNPRWLQLGSPRNHAELPSMENVFRQPFDMNLLRRVYGNVGQPTTINVAPPSHDHTQPVTVQSEHPSSSYHGNSDNQDNEHDNETHATEDTPMSNSVYV